jgi:hypothetical protein
MPLHENETRKHAFGLDYDAVRPRYPRALFTRIAEALTPRRSLQRERDLGARVDERGTATKTETGGAPMRKPSRLLIVPVCMLSDSTR